MSCKPMLLPFVKEAFPIVAPGGICTPFAINSWARVEAATAILNWKYGIKTGSTAYLPLSTAPLNPAAEPSTPSNSFCKIFTKSYWSAKLALNLEPDVENFFNPSSVILALCSIILPNPDGAFFAAVSARTFLNFETPYPIPPVAIKLVPAAPSETNIVL